VSTAGRADARADAIRPEVAARHAPVARGVVSALL
jgi:hypothetical protein